MRSRARPGPGGTPHRRPRGGGHPGSAGGDHGVGSPGTRSLFAGVHTLDGRPVDATLDDSPAARVVTALATGAFWAVGFVIAAAAGRRRRHPGRRRHDGRSDPRQRGRRADRLLRRPIRR
ncbi:hypothetical protein ACIRFH_10760 [Streptomyces sp. NPDC093586]|uniref:hypothetical protein n=1 Tax=Streptomyces sp. NPDC093586 TaxID=3366042 RepID=UPI00382EDAF3